MTPNRSLRESKLKGSNLLTSEGALDHVIAPAYYYCYKSQLTLLIPTKTLRLE